MSQFAWESEIVEGAQPEAGQQTPAEESGKLALSVDEFSALEDRVVRAVDLVKRERQARGAAEERAVLLEVQLAEQGDQMAQAQKDLDALRVERDQVRQRVERLLTQLDALEL